MLNRSDQQLAFTELDRHFANLMTRLAGKEDPDLWLAAALTSHVTQEGHVCLDLAAFAGKSLGSPDNPAETTYPALADWVRMLRDCRVVGSPGDFYPLLLDNSNRLYLCRYWRYEKSLTDFLRARNGLLCQGVNSLILQEGLDRLFPRSGDDAIDWQRIAALTAVQRIFSVITGGPGTGKTSTVVKILALLLEQTDERKLDIALVAPTGKAAAKLKDSVKSSKQTLNCSRLIREAIPEETSTLHRLLGAIPGSARFRYQEENQLPYDVVVVDEASMVDLPLMAKLTQAMPDHARLILLGDKDQLASVEPGSVFGDICGAGSITEASNEATVSPSAASSLMIESSGAAQPARSIVVLQKSFRFDETSGIGLLSQAVNAGDGSKALSLLIDETHQDIAWRDIPPRPVLENQLAAKILHGYGASLTVSSIEKAFQQFGRFQILCALRRGPYGMVSIGKLVETVLTRAKLIQPRSRWYHGQPIMVTQNDYVMKLFNGDLGIVFSTLVPGNESDEVLRAFFPSEGGSLRSLLPMRLPEHQSAYAMTVHKSQGSEFDEVLLLLPDTSSPVLTRELLYTAITRAKMRVEIWGKKPVFLEAVSRRLERTSGLKDALRV